jgi:hypothetical protein
MNLAELERKLIAAARSRPVSEAMPYAFEQRILAHVKERPRQDAWSLWAGALWRAAGSCVGVMLLLGAWTFFAPASSAPGTDLSQEFENTVLAAVDQEPPAEFAW